MRSRILATSTMLVVGFVALVLVISWFVIHAFAVTEIRRDLADSVRAFQRYFGQQREMLARKAIAVSRVPYLVAALGETSLDPRSARATLDELRDVVGDAGIVLWNGAGASIAERLPRGLALESVARVVDVESVLDGASHERVAASPEACAIYATPVVAGGEVVGALALVDALDRAFADEIHLVTARDVVIVRGSRPGAVEAACVADRGLELRRDEWPGLLAHVRADGNEARELVLAGKRRLACAARLGDSDVSIVFSRALDDYVQVIGSAWGWIVLAGILVALVGLLSSTALARRLARPIDELARASDALASGDLRASVAVESQDEIGRLGASFNAMARRIESLIADVRDEARRAEEANRAKDRFLACVSHELRTPLTSVFAYAEILESMREGNEGEGASEEGEFLAVIKGEAERLMELIDEVMELVAFDTDTLRFAQEPFAVDALVQELAHELAASWSGELRVELEGGDALDGDAVVRGDPARIAKAMRKVLANARNWSPDDGAVEIRVEPSPGEVRVRVIDEGPGVAEADRERIFERFVQAGNGLTDKPAGTGLGLAFAREVLVAHGAWIRCEQAAGGGAEFVIGIPRTCHREPYDGGASTIDDTRGTRADILAPAP